MPPGGISCRFFFSGFSATIASVVNISPRTEAGTLKGEPHHLSGIDHADLQEVFECFRLGVESKIIFSLECLIEHNGTLATGIYGNLHQQLGQRPLEDINAPFFFPFGIDLIQNADTADQNNTAAGNNPLFHSRSSGIQGIFHSSNKDSIV